MRIADLYGRFRGADVFVCGTGPSLRTFPLAFLAGRVVIGLNQFWRHAPSTLSVTVHPELLDDYEAAERDPGFKNHTAWVVKKKPPREKLTVDDPRYYVFHTSTDLKALWERPEHTLYLGEGIQCTAIDLALRAGARSVVLVGCDGTNLGGDFHGHDQHVRWLGQAPADQYALYRKHTARVRTAARDHFRVPVLTLTPFVSVGLPDEDYLRLCRELGLPKLPPPKDTSTYVRPKKPGGDKQ